ncbi:MAG: glycosyltransferase [Planctomycetes bacterium]|nr:glycosyltransferase [Planctomycetota bacterium]
MPETEAVAKPQVSIVVPVYNEEDSIPELIQRITDAMESTGRPYEIVAVDDGSSDNSLALLLDYQKKFPGLTVVELNRNFGQHAAVFAGFETARGDVMVTLDADLQNPPEEIENLLELWDRGHDVVGTIRRERQDNPFRKTVSWLVNTTTNYMTGLKISDYGCMLRAYDRHVVESMVQGQEVSTFIPALAAAFARNMAEVEVSHAARTRGESKYSLLKLIMLHFDLVTSFSMWPLRLLILLGAAVALLGMGFGAFLLFMRLVMGPAWAAEGVFTLFAILFVFIGALFFGLGLVGEYLGRIYSEVRRRPRFVVRGVYEHAPAVPAAGKKAGQSTRSTTKSKKKSGGKKKAKSG